MGEAFEERTQCMTPERSAFLAHWLHLVDLEEGDQSARRAEIWALPGGQLGSSGRMPFCDSNAADSRGSLSQPDKRGWVAAGPGQGLNNRGVQPRLLHSLA